MTKSNYDRLKDQIKVIADESGYSILDKMKDNSMGPCEVDNEYGAHTILKLAYLNYYIGIFSKIANRFKSKGLFDQVIFMDAFGGSGLVRIRGTRYAVLGSSILAAINDKFDKIVSFEIDKKRARLLSDRLTIICGEKAVVVNGDVNSEIKSIVDKHINSKSIVLFFIDPEGMEPNFSKIKAVYNASKFVDTIMNFTWGVYRLQGRIEKRFNENDLRKMTTFLPTYREGNTLDESLINMFNEEFGKPVGDSVPIKSVGDKKEYSIILRVRETVKGSTFIDPMKEFGSIISTYDGENAKTILRTIKGEQDLLT